jgi:hypothetical protein
VLSKKVPGTFFKLLSGAGARARDWRDAQAATAQGAGAGAVAESRKARFFCFWDCFAIPKTKKGAQIPGGWREKMLSPLTYREKTPIVESYG